MLTKEQLDADIAEFLAKGKKIEIIDNCPTKIDLDFGDEDVEATVEYPMETEIDVDLGGE